MPLLRQSVVESTEVIRVKLGSVRPDAGLITGTGLSGTLSGLRETARIDYADIPHFPRATVASHKGCLVSGKIGKKQILVFQGRFHLYEGYSPGRVAFPVRLLQELGAPVLILTNAAGGINLDFTPGQIMTISDHINLTGKNPLTGPEEPAWGLRFPDMTRVYDPDLRGLAAETAAALGMPLPQGVYAGLQGPSLETPAETRFLKGIGADAVGFSTVMEAIAGVQAGMRILGLSMITNVNDPDAPVRTTLEAVVDTAKQSSVKLNRLLSRMIPLLPDQG